MTVAEYQKQAMRTSDDRHDRILNGCLGLIGESGEVVDLAKKWAFQSGDSPLLPADKLIDECGDVLWYCCELCEGRGIDMSRVEREMRQSCARVHLTGELTHMAARLAQLCQSVYAYYYPANGNENKPLGYPVMLTENVGGWDAFDIVTLRVSAVMMAVECILAEYCHASLWDAMARNIEKLRRRYPDGFDPERSLHRAE